MVSHWQSWKISLVFRKIDATLFRYVEMWCSHQLDIDSRGNLAVLTSYKSCLFWPRTTSSVVFVLAGAAAFAKICAFGISLGIHAADNATGAKHDVQNDLGRGGT